MCKKKIFAFLFFLLWPVIPCAAQDAASAKAFMNSAFRLYQNRGYGIYGEHGNDKELTKRFVHSSLQALIDKDVKTVAAAGTDIPYAGDGDLICDCQDWDGIWVRHMDLKVENPKLAYVTATITLFDPKAMPENDLRTIKYTLVPEQGQWKIYDVALLDPAPNANEPKSLRGGIQKELDYYAHLPKY